MRLDGELYAMGGVWCPIDVRETAEVRAEAVMGDRSRRLVAELRTAAWIWGVPGTLVRPLELCADVRSRARLRPGAGAVVREVVLPADDVIELGGVRVTSPLRTVVDLARTGRADADLLRRLVAAAGLDRRSVNDRLRAGRLPGTRRARDLLAEAGQPLLTR